MQFTSAICVVILTATATVSAAPGGWSYGACNSGRRVGCSWGSKREAAPEPAPVALPEAAPGLSYGACNSGRRVGCSWGSKREAAPAPAPAPGLSYGACNSGRRVGCSWGSKREAAPAPVADPGLSYGACQSGTRVGCSWGSKREAEPVAAPGLSYGACNSGRRVGCSWGSKRDLVGEHIHDSYKRAAADFASALTPTDGMIKRSPVADFCHSESGPCTLAARSADALASAIAQDNFSPEDYYHSLALGDVFAGPEGSENEKRDITEVTEVTKREAEAFCNAEGEACHMTKRAAEAVVAAMSSFATKRNAEMGDKAVRSAEAIYDAAKALL